MDIEKEHRLKIVRISDIDLVSFLSKDQVFRMDGYPTGVSVMYFDGIPQDARVRCVSWADRWRAWEIILEHPSFDPVPMGGMIPAIPGLTSTIGVVLAVACVSPDRLNLNEVRPAVVEEADGFPPDILEAVDQLEPTRIIRYSAPTKPLTWESAPGPDPLDVVFKPEQTWRDTPPLL